MVIGLQKHAGETVRQRASSPKLQVLNTALITAQSTLSPAQARRDPAVWGHLVESAVGAHLLNDLAGSPVEVGYWRERGHEVDFVLRAGASVCAIEVKSGRPRAAPPGLAAFAARHGPVRALLVAGGGIPIEEFLSRPARTWIDASAARDTSTWPLSDLLQKPSTALVYTPAAVAKCTLPHRS